MAAVCNFVVHICGADLHSCEGRNRRRQLPSCYCDSDGGSAFHGVGYGLFNQCPDGAFCDKQKELDIFDFVGAGDRRIVALLLQGAADGGSFKGGAGRQAERSDYIGAGIFFLHEKFTAKSITGCILIGIGTLLMVL